MAATASSLEEAAHIASEFIYSIDNLPSEVAHILQEIKIKDTRTQELQTEIDKETARYIRHAKVTNTGSPAATASPIPRAPSPKSMAIPGKVSACYAEIQVLAGEKQALAQRLIELLQQTRTRLDIELNKVRVLQGEPPEPLMASGASAGRPMPALAIGGEAFKNPVLAVTESLRNALGGASPLAETRSPAAAAVPHTPASAAVAVAGGSSNKRRKVAASSSPSIKVPARSASPTVQPAPTQRTHERSRLSRQLHPPVQDEDEDMDAEGDDDVDGDGDDGDGDDRLYCYCQKQSYGDMVACDNEGDCPYEWFHLSCTNIKGTPPDRWYCEHCKDKVAQSTRKGRKK